MELYFLGTGAGMPSRQRNVTSVILNLQEELGCSWMFDCGEGTQHQILQAPVKLGRLTRLFVSHLHGDHIFGIPGLLTSRSNQGAEEPFTICGPKGIRRYVETCLDISESRVNYEVRFEEIEEGEVCRAGPFRVEAKPLEHRIFSLGYRVVEADSPGTLDSDKLKAQGLAPGPLYGKLKNGESVTLPDGRVLHGRDFRGPDIPGRVVTLLGDTRTCETVYELAKNADVLVHEATFAGDRADLARQFYHSTAEQAARTALRARVKTLILTHISSRYPGEEAERLLAEARPIFPGTYLARDFWSYRIPKGQATT
jgi:ribonuclease Z